MCENEQIQKKERGPVQKFSDKINSLQMQEFLKATLMAKKDSFVNNLTTLVANDAKLQECDAMSLIYAGLKATALGLPLDANLGFAYVIPYRNTKAGKTEAQFQMGYKGFIQLAERSGMYAGINAGKVYEGELSKFDKLSGEIELGGQKTSDKVVGYFAYIRLVTGFTKVKYMTVEEIEKHAGRYSKTYASKISSVREQSKWSTDFDAMAEKTVLKLLIAKYGPVSVEYPATSLLRDAIEADQAIIGEGGGCSYIDAPDEQEQRTVAVDAAKEEMRRQGTLLPEMP